MFKVNENKGYIKDFHKITSNKLVLFNDGDNDIIFTGTNSYSNRILCSIMFEDDDEAFLRYIHVIVTEKQYSEFLNSKKSFRKIIDNNNSIYLVDYDYSMKEIDFNYIGVNEIPNDFLPLNNSFCPDFIYDSSFSYSLSLTGGLADLHKTIASELSSVSTKVSEFLKSSTEFLKDFDLDNRIYIEALEPGSFKVNYKIDIIESKQISIVENSTEKINSFLSNYFKYFFNSLPEENDDVLKNDVIDSENFKRLEKELESIYEEQHALPIDGVEQKLVDLISFSAKQIEEIDYGESFNELKFQQTTKEGYIVPIGIINSEFNNNIQNKVFDVSEFIADDIIIEDDTPKEYPVQIYKFSSETGKGSGYYTNAENSISRIIVHGIGRDKYQNTIFTKSMDEGKVYIFKGIGKYKNGILIKVTCEIP